MESKEFKKEASVILKSLGFKKYKSFWIRRGKEVSELVWLQRSYYSRLYYFRYQYLINDLYVEDIVGGHVFAEPQLDRDYLEEIEQLCDLENSIADDVRMLKMREILNKALEGKEKLVTTESKLIGFILSCKGAFPSKPVIDYLKRKHPFIKPETWGIYKNW